MDTWSKARIREHERARRPSNVFGPRIATAASALLEYSRRPGTFELALRAWVGAGSRRDRWLLGLKLVAASAAFGIAGEGCGAATDITDLGDFGASLGSGGARTGTGGQGNGGDTVVAFCGNGQLDQGEACDGQIFHGQTCASATSGALTLGFLNCTGNCQLDYSNCVGTGGGFAGGGGAVGAGGGFGTGGFAVGGFQAALAGSSPTRASASGEACPTPATPKAACRIRLGTGSAFSATWQRKPVWSTTRNARANAQRQCEHRLQRANRVRRATTAARRYPAASISLTARTATRV